MKRDVEVARTWDRWALAFLALTVVAGTWMRALLAGEPWAMGANFAFARHAHSHVAFFGWVTMALCGTIAAALPRPAGIASKLRALAHAMGVASALAFYTFLRGGYDAASIVVSVLHVVLWIAFAWTVRRQLAGVRQPARAFFRGALFMLLVAGATTLGPGIVLATGVSDPWLREFSVKLFLATFVGGWMMLGVMGAVYPLLERARFAMTVRGLVLVGAVPASLLHVAAPPPWGGLPWIGRVATGLLGLAALLFAVDVLRGRELPSLVRLAGTAALVEGVLQLVAATGVGADLIRSQPVVIAYLHLVLLGVVTPSLLAVMQPARRATWPTAVLAGGGGVMIASLAAMGWPWLGGQAAAMGADAAFLLRAGLAGAMFAALAVLLLVVTNITESGANPRR